MVVVLGISIGVTAFNVVPVGTNRNNAEGGNPNAHPQDDNQDTFPS